VFSRVFTRVVERRPTQFLIWREWKKKIERWLQAYTGIYVFPFSLSYYYARVSLRELIFEILELLFLNEPGKKKSWISVWWYRNVNNILAPIRLYCSYTYRANRVRHVYGANRNAVYARARASYTSVDATFSRIVRLAGTTTGEPAKRTPIERSPFPSDGTQRANGIADERRTDSSRRYGPSSVRRAETTASFLVLWLRKAYWHRL